MDQKMDILIVKPGEAPSPATITNTLEAVEETLGGVVQIGCFLPQRVLLISRQDGAGLALNRPMPGGKGYICGTFLLCGVPEEGCHFASLTPMQQREFKGIFTSEYPKRSCISFVCDPFDREQVADWEKLWRGQPKTGQ